MKGEKLIHVKFEYFAGVQSKRDILSTEMDLLRINQIIKRFRELRMQEMELKLVLERKLRALKLDFGRLQNLLPEPEVPAIMSKVYRKAEEIGIETKIKAPKTVITESKKDDLDSQLMEIQKKLNALAG